MKQSSNSFFPLIIGEIHTKSGHLSPSLVQECAAELFFFSLLGRHFERTNKRPNLFFFDSHLSAVPYNRVLSIEKKNPFLGGL